MKTTLKEASDKLYNAVTSGNYNPTMTVFRPVVALGYGSNIEVIDEYYTNPTEAGDRAKELIENRHTLGSCGFQAQVAGYCGQKIDQDGEVPASMTGIKYKI